MEGEVLTINELLEKEGYTVNMASVSSVEVYNSSTKLNKFSFNIKHSLKEDLIDNMKLKSRDCENKAELKKVLEKVLICDLAGLI